MSQPFLLDPLKALRALARVHMHQRTTRHGGAWKSAHKLSYVPDLSRVACETRIQVCRQHFLTRRPRVSLPLKELLKSLDSRKCFRRHGFLLMSAERLGVLPRGPERSEGQREPRGDRSPCRIQRGVMRARSRRSTMPVGEGRPFLRHGDHRCGTQRPQPSHVPHPGEWNPSRHNQGDLASTRKNPSLFLRR
jgi:hypothetical protein